jgi:uncharacterized protein YegP (UPF0339 family)
VIQIKTAENGETYYTVVAKNGEVLVTSETYESIQSCRKGIAALKKVIRDVDVKTVVEK